MKFTLNTLKSGMLCFIFTPMLMAVLVVLTMSGIITEESELHPWIIKGIDWRYSSDGFAWFLLMSVFLSVLVTVILKTQEMPRHERNFIGRFFNFAGSMLSKVFIFWAGVFLAWSFGSMLIDFIHPISDQLLVIPIFLVLSVLSRFGFLKLKHILIRG